MLGPGAESTNDSGGKVSATNVPKSAGLSSALLEVAPHLWNTVRLVSVLSTLLFRMALLGCVLMLSDNTIGHASRPEFFCFCCKFPWICICLSWDFVCCCTVWTSVILLCSSEGWDSLSSWADCTLMSAFSFETALQFWISLLLALFSPSLSAAGACFRLWSSSLSVLSGKFSVQFTEATISRASFGSNSPDPCRQSFFKLSFKSVSGTLISLLGLSWDSVKGMRLAGVSSDIETWPICPSSPLLCVNFASINSMGMLRSGVSSLGCISLSSFAVPLVFLWSAFTWLQSCFSLSQSSFASWDLDCCTASSCLTSQDCGFIAPEAWLVKLNCCLGSSLDSAAKNFFRW